MFKLDLEKAEEPDMKLPTFSESKKSKRIPEKHLLLLHDYTKAFDSVVNSKQTLENSLRRWDYQTT